MAIFIDLMYVLVSMLCCVCVSGINQFCEHLYRHSQGDQHIYLSIYLSINNCLSSFTVGSGVDHCNSDAESLQIKDMLQRHTVILIITLLHVKIFKPEKQDYYPYMHDHVSLLK